MQPTVPLARNVRGGVIVHVRGHHPSRAVLLIRSVFVVRVSEVVLADLFARARRQVPASASSSSSSSVRCRDSKRITFALVARRVDAPHAPVQYLRPAFRRAVRTRARSVARSSARDRARRVASTRASREIGRGAGRASRRVSSSRRAHIVDAARVSAGSPTRVETPSRARRGARRASASATRRMRARVERSFAASRAGRRARARSARGAE